MNDWEEEGGAGSPFYSPSGKLSEITLGDWMALDRWNFYEVACLCTGYTPYFDIRVISAKRFQYAIGGDMTPEDVNEANRLLGLFESAQWSKYGVISSDFKTDQEAYRTFLNAKSVPIHPLLEHALASLEVPSVNPKIIETLAPVIDLIQKFQTSSHYEDFINSENTYVTKLHKGLVQDWLVGKSYMNKKITKDREGFVIADLILDYYNSIP